MCRQEYYSSISHAIGLLLIFWLTHLFMACQPIALILFGAYNLSVRNIDKKRYNFATDFLIVYF